MTNEEKNKYIELLTSPDEEVRITTMVEILENRIDVLNPNEFYEIYNQCSNIIHMFKTLDQKDIIDKFDRAYAQNSMHLVLEVDRLNQSVIQLICNLDKIRNSLRNMINTI